MFSFFFCRMVLKATGYKSVPINGLPSDHKKCESQLFVRLISFTGLYLCGWLKRGPVAKKLGGLGKKIVACWQHMRDIEGVWKSEKAGSKGLMQLIERERGEEEEIHFHCVDRSRDAKKDIWHAAC
ncbi:unnamed protein product [Brassica rapa]|uniref:Uncharacterized protein n=2 Tax=Brassica TaxID=3705 RepID=A0A8D9GGR7_BRACM|nr:unnamed protein product [Brassica napus]CAG7880296.1 unnamed protein product [Brassica rapa]